MIRMDALIAAGAYRNACTYAEDYDLWLRLSEIGEITNLADTLMQFRVHSAQVSQKMRLRQRAATALARQMAILRRAGLMESVDMSLPPMEALLALLAVRGALEMPIEKGEAKDIEVMFRASASSATPALISVWTRRLMKEAGIWSK